MMRSLRARVSPCFILMRFLSKHFMAYLEWGHGVPAATVSPQQGQHPAPTHGRDCDNVPTAPQHVSPQQSHCGCPSTPQIPGGSLQAGAFPLHFARVRFPAAVNLPEATTADDSVNAEIVHGELEG